MTDFPYTSDLLPAAKTIAGTDGVSDTVTIEVVAGGLTVDLSGWTFATWTPGEPDNDLVIIDGSDRTEPLTITGSDQDDFITGGTGVDEIDGGAGNDTADYSYRTEAVVVTLNGATGATVSVGGVDEDTIRNIENIVGGSAGDTLTGDANDNVFTGGDGADTVDGGAGSDTAVYRDKTEAVILTLNGSTDATASVGGVDEDTVRNIENIVGGSAGDTLTGDDNNNVLDGGLGADTLDGGAGNDTITYDGLDLSIAGGADTDTLLVKAAAVIDLSVIADQSDILDTAVVTGFENVDASGSSDAVTLTGDSGANVLTGGAAGDTIDGGLGADTLDGGAGNDTITYDGLDVSIAGGTDTDTLLVKAAAVIDLSQADQSPDTVVVTGFENVDASGSSDAVTLTGDSGANVLTGGAGGDTIDGGLGADTLDGKAGNDTIVYDGLDVSIAGGADNDTLLVKAAAVIDLSQADQSPDTAVVTGFENVDASGSSDAVTLTGDSGANVLTGGAAGDTIDGGLGADTLDGKAGNDTIVYDGLDVSIAGGTDTDTLLVKAAAVIDLSQADQSPDTVVVTGFENVDASGSSDAVTLTGDSGANVLTGGAGGDTIDGGAGADTIKGLGGDDTIRGFTTGDTVNGGANFDTLRLTATSTALNGAADGALINVEAVSAALAAAGVTINLTAQSDGFTITGSGHADTITGSTAADIINAGAGADVVAGFTSGDTVNGGTEGDTLTLAATSAALNGAADGALVAVEAVSAASAGTGVTINLGAQSDGFTITGSGFADTITGSTAADIINAGAGDDTIAGFAGNDVIDGGEGSDRLAGDGGVDVLRGGAGNDTFRGLKLDGNDVYDGGADIDTVDYSATTSGVKIDLTPENRSGQAITGEPTTFAALMLAAGFADATTQVGLATGADTGADVLVSIENAIGGAGADTMFGSAVANTLEGAGGDDKIWARGDDDTIRGGDGNDVLVGGFGGSSGKPSGNDIIFGDAGNDELYGEDGNDVLWGGKGSDQYAGGGGHDVLHFDSDGASDTAWGGAESDTFVFHAGFGIDRIKDLLATGTDSDKIDLSDFSVSFKDLKIAQVGQNTEISGFGGGNKIILEVVNAGAITSVDFVFSRLDREKGTKKNDTISGGSENDRIKGLGGKDKLKGKGGNDTLDGGGGADKLYGDAGDDNLKGGGGGDKLFGGTGIDTLSGGSGRDSFVFRSPGDGMDSITDFASGNDRLEISATGFGGGLAAKSAATLVTLADIHGYVDGGSKGIFLFDNAGTDLGTIYWDANGGSSTDAIAFARISGSSLLETDFRIS